MTGFLSCPNNVPICKFCFIKWTAKSDIGQVPETLCPWTVLTLQLGTPSQSGVESYIIKNLMTEILHSLLADLSIATEGPLSVDIKQKPWLNHTTWGWSDKFVQTKSCSSRISPCFAENPSPKNIDNKYKSVTNKYHHQQRDTICFTGTGGQVSNQPHPLFASVFVS